jgi:sugar lactone lactonase YvrE
VLALLLAACGGSSSDSTAGATANSAQISSVQPASPLAGAPVSFSGTASGGSGPYSYAWNFGDGSSGTGSSTAHTYSAAGGYSVVLTVTDAHGRQATASASITLGASGLTLLAGSPGGPGNVDGTGGSAAFDSPAATAVDSSGNVYVADSHNNTIRKITPTGVVTTLAGKAGSSGSADGTGSAARFFQPAGIAVDAGGNVYVADNASTIRKITPARVVTTLAGSAGLTGSTDDTGANARFAYPRGLAVDGGGTVYVADDGNNTIRKISPGGVVTTLAGVAGSAGSLDGTGSAARFNAPVGVAVDSGGTVYVSDYSNRTIRKITPGGTVSTLAGTAGSSGSADGSGAAAQFGGPYGLALSSGSLYVADAGNNTLRKITATGVVTTLAGTAGSSGSADGSGAAAQFNVPLGLAAGAGGSLYVADSGNNTIRKITPTGLASTLAGAAGSYGSADGSGAAAQFGSADNGPHGVAADSSGNVYVADTGNNTIRKITPAGVVTTLAGAAGVHGSADGTGAGAQFNMPGGLTVDSSGNVYVADNGNATIRKITPAGLVTTLAGFAGHPGSANGTGTGARFHGPQGLTVDGSGNVYVADTLNQLIRKITPAGVVTTLAGAALTPGSLDGSGSGAQFNNPAGLAVDSGGNVFVADTGNFTVRMITPGGVVTTLAGTAGIVGSADGSGAAAQFNVPVALAVDSVGNVYVADYSNNTLRRITAVGVVTTVVGAAGQVGNKLGATLPGAITAPAGLALLPNGGLVFSSNNAVLTALGTALGVGL